MNPSEYRPKIALIVTEQSIARYGYKLALDLDERLTAYGFICRIVDMQDTSYRFSDLDRFESVVFIGSHSGPMYNLETHRILTGFRQALRYKPVGTIMVASEKIQAESAELQLRRVLLSLGATNPASLVVLSPEHAFDARLNIKDEVLNDQILSFLVQFRDGIAAPEKLTA